MNEDKGRISESLREACEVSDPVAFRISHIDSEFVRDSSAQQLNKVIIPTACSLMLLIVLMVLAIEAFRYFRLSYF